MMRRFQGSWVRSGFGRRAAGAAAINLLILMNGGCSVVRVLYAPQFTEHKSIKLTVRRDTSAAAVVDTTAAPAASVDSEMEPATGPPVRQPSGGSTPVAAVPGSGAGVPPDAEAPEPSTIAPAEPPPSISIALPEEQRERLERIARAEMAMAESIIGQLAPRLTADKDREKLKTVHGLVEQTHAALDREDIQAAANLAHKAKLLATQLLSQ